jgi:mono/diheme cytochrome c family protein
MKYGILFMIASLALQGCMDFKKVKAPSDEQAQLDEPVPNIPAEQISFADVQRYVFNPMCIRCHSGTQPAGDINLTNYAALLSDPDAVKGGNPDTSSLYTEVASGGMPKDGAALSQARIGLIYDWIKAGAVEAPSATPSPEPSSVPSPTPRPVVTPPPPLPSSPVFSDIQSRIITPSCIKCHGGAHPSGKVDLSSYAAIMAKAKLVISGNPQGSSFYTEIATGSMPKKRTHLSPTLVSMAYDWIKAGAPEK